MHALRQARFLARLVLAWFALSLGVAIAAPLVHPVGMELVCTAGGATKLMVKGDEGTRAPGGHTLDCPLCVVLDAPPPALDMQAPLAAPQAGAVPHFPESHFALAAAAPLPARGPPLR